MIYSACAIIGVEVLPHAYSRGPYEYIYTNKPTHLLFARFAGWERTRWRTFSVLCSTPRTNRKVRRPGHSNIKCIIPYAFLPLVVSFAWWWYVMSRSFRRVVQDLEKEGHKAISLQDENPQLYLDDDEVVMGTSPLPHFLY